jgi:hypothetical protein
MLALAQASDFHCAIESHGMERLDANQAVGGQRSVRAGLVIDMLACRYRKVGERTVLRVYRHCVVHEAAAVEPRHASFNSCSFDAIFANLQPFGVQRMGLSIKGIA